MTPERDFYHAAVRKALEREGWRITHDPLLLPFGRTRVFIDIGAEAPLGAERAGRKIAVEIKSFLGASEVWDLERALGQYRLYVFLLSRHDPDRTLFLAVPSDTWSSLADEADTRDLLTHEQTRVIVFNDQQEVIEKWIEPPNTEKS